MLYFCDILRILNFLACLPLCTSTVLEFEEDITLRIFWLQLDAFRLIRLLFLGLFDKKFQLLSITTSTLFSFCHCVLFIKKKNNINIMNLQSQFLSYAAIKRDNNKLNNTFNKSQNQNKTRISQQIINISMQYLATNIMEKWKQKGTKYN